MDLPQGLLAVARNYLDITWDDPDGDKKLSGILARGMDYLDKISGKPLDYSANEKPLELLLDYARYVRANALSDFQGNYSHELLMLQIFGEVTRDGDKPANV